ncbi:MAG TPA: hypothetical protein VF556_02990 [Pyrinomonadaceae bacterium]|jgi:hypothetical protein
MDKVQTFTNEKSFMQTNAKNAKIYFCILISSFVFCLSVSTYAQQPEVDEIAPPPLKILSKTEKKQLDEITDLKKRTNLALEMMEAKLKKIEELDDRNEFALMYEELGGFHALMDYTFNFLYRNSANRKNLGSLKRYEQGLRAFPPRLEVIRRELPLKYESYLRELLKNIRDTRSKAIEPFYGDSVVTDSNN